MFKKKLAKILSWLFFIVMILLLPIQRVNLLTMRWVLMLQNILLFCMLLTNRLLNPPPNPLSRLARILDLSLLFFNPLFFYLLVFGYLD